MPIRSASWTWVSCSRRRSARTFAPSREDSRVTSAIFFALPVLQRVTTLQPIIDFSQHVAPTRWSFPLELPLWLLHCHTSDVAVWWSHESASQRGGPVHVLRNFVRAGPHRTRRPPHRRSPLRRDHASLLEGRRRAAAGLVQDRAYAGEAGSGAPLGSAARGELPRRPRRADRKHGGPAGPRRSQGHLPLGLAGRRGREHRRPDVSRSEPLSGRQP